MGLDLFSTCINCLCIAGTKYLTAAVQRRQDLIWLKGSEVLAHGRLAHGRSVTAGQVGQSCTPHGTGGEPEKEGQEPDTVPTVVAPPPTQTQTG